MYNDVCADDGEDEEENGGYSSDSMGCQYVGMCLVGFFNAAVGVSGKTSPFTFTDGVCW
jgi:hypothetical protein